MDRNRDDQDKIRGRASNITIEQCRDSGPDKDNDRWNGSTENTHLHSTYVPSSTIHFDLPTEDPGQAFKTSSSSSIFPENSFNSNGSPEVLDKPLNSTCVPDSTFPSVLGRFKENGVPFE